MIGIALIKECIKNNVEVLAIVRRNSFHIMRLPKSDLIKIYECDLDELYNIEETTDIYDVFYHMAWCDTAKEQRDNPIVQEQNIKFTLDAVRLAKKLGCTKFIGAGSQAEYGKVDTIITPDTVCNPISAYGMAKYTAGLMSRKLCEQYGITHIWARIFSVYGCYDKEETMVNYAVDRFIKGEKAYFSSAMQMWDYLYEEDAGKIFYLIGKLVAGNRVYCIANGEARPLKEYIMELRDVCNPDAEYELLSKEVTGNVINLQAGIEELVQDIGYRPEVPFKRGIGEVVQYRKKKK